MLNQVSSLLGCDVVSSAGIHRNFEGLKYLHVLNPEDGGTNIRRNFRGLITRIHGVTSQKNLSLQQHHCDSLKSRM
jgi:hypothetical protein